MRVNISPTKLLKSIELVNTYFHNNMENDKQFKRKYYQIKDDIIKACINGVIKNVSWQYEGFEIDNRLMTYAVIRLTSYIKGKESANLTVHFPFKLIPSLEKPVEYIKFTPYVRNYRESNTTKAEFMKAYDYIHNIGKNLYCHKVNGLHKNELFNILSQTIRTEKESFKVVACRVRGGIIEPFGEFINVKPSQMTLFPPLKNGVINIKNDYHTYPCVFETTLTKYKKAVSELMTFKFDKVMAYMCDQGLMTVKY